MSGRTEVKAVVSLAIEVEPSDRWNPDATVQQVRAQGIEGALGKLRKALSEPGIRIVGQPTVKVVTIDTE